MPQRITMAWAAEVTVADIQGLIRRCIDKGDTAGLTRIYEMGYGKTSQARQTKTQTQRQTSQT